MAAPRNSQKQPGYQDVVEALTTRLQSHLAIYDLLNSPSFLSLSQDCRKTLIVTYGQSAQKILKGTKRDLKKYFQGKELDASSIWTTAGILLKSFQKTSRHYFGDENSVYDWLDDDDILRLQNLITAIYLGSWLDSDKENYQTIYGFEKNPYKKEGKYGHALHDGPIESAIKGGQRADAKYQRYDALKINQQKYEHTFIRKSPKKVTHGTPKSLIELTWIKAKQDGHLLLLDFLFQNYQQDAPLSPKMEADLAEACLAYQQYIATIYEIKIGTEAPVENNRKFVAASVMLYRMEQANLFHLVGRIAQRICENKIDPSRYSAPIAEQVISRFSEFFSYMFPPRTTKTRDANPNSRMNILNYDFEINLMFCSKDVSRPCLESVLNLARRYLLQDVLTLLENLYPPKDQHTWSPADFCSAALFFRDSYPITQGLLEVEFPELSDDPGSDDDARCSSFYQQYWHQYVTLMNTLGSHIREDLKIPKT